MRYRLLLTLLLLLVPLSARASVPLSASDSGTCATANACLSIKVAGNNGAATFTLSGTFSATAQFEVSGDNGTTWYSLNVTPPNSTTAVTSATAVGVWRANVAGYTNVRIRLSAYTSGPVNATIQVAQMSARSGGGGGAPSGPAGGALSGTYPNPTAGQPIAPSQNVWSLTLGTCGTQTNCTNIYGDAHSVTDVTSNSTTTVTCPNNDCSFTSTDSYGRPVMATGEKIWATTQGSGAGSGLLLYTTVVCPVTTVASFTAQSVTLNAACTASGTANVVLYWGHDDGPTIHGLTEQCVTYTLPSGIYSIISDTIFNSLPTCATTQTAADLTFPYPGLVAQQGNNTGFYVSPDFNYSDCLGHNGHSTTICVGAGLGQINHILFTGTGLTSASNSNCVNAANTVFLSTGAQGGNLNNVVVGGICPGEAGMVGIEANGVDEIFNDGGAIQVGSIACQIASTGVITFANDCHDDLVSTGLGLLVLNGAIDNDFSSYYLYVAKVNAGGVFNGHGTSFSAVTGLYALEVAGTVTDDGDIFTCSVGGCTQIDATGQESSRNSTFNGAGATAVITNGSGGTFVDQGGNKITAGQVFLQNSVQSSNYGTQIVAGTCQGTATSSTTLGLYGAGELATLNCTSTTVNLGVPMSRSGTATGLGASASHAGVNASSGVVTVLKNGSATALTCTIGTATLCHESTHAFTYVVGDVLSIQFTTQSSEVLAGVTAEVLAW